MFDGRWKRTHTDTAEQLAKVLGLESESKVMNSVLLDLLRYYVQAQLTTEINEDETKIKISRRFYFPTDDTAEEKQVSFSFDQVSNFPVSIMVT